MHRHNYTEWSHRRCALTRTSNHKETESKVINGRGSPATWRQPTPGNNIFLFCSVRQLMQQKHEWVKKYVWWWGVNACWTIAENTKEKLPAKLCIFVCVNHTNHSCLYVLCGRSLVFSAPGTGLCVYWTTPLTGNNTWKWRHVTKPPWEIIITNNQTVTGH